MYSSGVLDAFTLLCNQYPERFSFCKTKTLYSLINNSHSPSHLTTNNHHSTSCLNEFDYSRYLCKWKHTVSVCVCCVCDWLIITLAQCSQGSSRLYYVLELPLFLRLNDIPLYVCTSFCLSIHPWMDTWVVPTFWLLWIVMLWTCVYRCLFEMLTSTVLYKYPEMELLDHIVFLYLIFWGTSILFSIVLHQGFHFSISSPPVVIFY